jgi:hypothetical protein
MASIEVEEILTPEKALVIENLTGEYGDIFPVSAVIYKKYGGEDTSQDGIVAEGLGNFYPTPREDLVIDEEAQTIKFVAYSDEYIVRPMTNKDRALFSQDTLEQIDGGLKTIV